MPAERLQAFFYLRVVLEKISQAQIKTPHLVDAAFTIGWWADWDSNPGPTD